MDQLIETKTIVLSPADLQPRQCPHHAELKEAITEIRTTVSAIHVAISGDERMGHRGLVRRMSDMEFAVADLARGKWYERGVVAGVTGAVLTVWEAGKQFFSK